MYLQNLQPLFGMIKHITQYAFLKEILYAGLHIILFFTS